jgi:hypothetical protein
MTQLPPHQYRLTIIAVGAFAGQPAKLPRCGKCDAQRSRATDRRGCPGVPPVPVRPTPRMAVARPGRFVSPMTEDERRRVYVGGLYSAAALTPRQRRRLAHKANLARKRADAQ